jgi:restriction system protein
MPIWDHKYHSPFLVEVPESKRRNAPWLPFHPDTCTFCVSGLSVFRQAATIATEKWRFPCTGTSTLRVCQVCGWWTVAFDYTVDLGLDVYMHTHSTSGALRTLDLADISVPTEELRRYLLARYGDRFHVHPRVYEDIVASVFRDFGYQVRATSYSGDEGIDVFALDGPSDVLVGVQVKRWRHTIKAEQIRAFAGALLLNRATRGIYITTSAYQRGASRTANSFTELGMPIELWDAESFYDRLKITSREVYNDVDEPTAPFSPFWQSPGQMPEVMSNGCGRG